VPLRLQPSTEGPPNPHWLFSNCRFFSKPVDSRQRVDRYQLIEFSCIIPELISKKAVAYQHPSRRAPALTQADIQGAYPDRPLRD
jgi:hypothetical protein